MSTAEKLREHFRKHPNANPRLLAEKYECSDSQAYTARAQVREEEETNGMEPVVLMEPRARKEEPKRDLVEDVKIIKEIGIDRVRTILELF